MDEDREYELSVLAGEALAAIEEGDSVPSRLPLEDAEVFYRELANLATGLANAIGSEIAAKKRLS